MVPARNRNHYKYSTSRIDAITSSGGMETVREHIRFGQNPQWFDYTRGYIMENPWGGGRWVVFLFGYVDDTPAEAKQFDSLRMARQWGKRTIRERRQHG